MTIISWDLYWGENNSVIYLELTFYGITNKKFGVLKGSFLRVWVSK